MPSRKTPRPSDFTRRENLFVLSAAGVVLLAIVLALTVHPRGYKIHLPERKTFRLTYVDNLTLNDTKFMIIPEGVPWRDFEEFAGLYQNGYLEKAREVMLRVVKRENDRRVLLAAYNNLANIHDDIAEFTRAGQYYAQASSFGPKDPYLLFNWASSLYHSGKVKASLDRFILCEKYKRRFDKALMNIGNLQYELKSFDKAIAAYEQIPSRSDLYRQARYNIAACLTTLGPVENRRKIQQTYYSLLSRNDSIAYLSALNLGNLSWNERDYDKAKDYYRMACTINTQNYTAFFNLALIEKQTREYPESIAHFQKAIQNRATAGNVYQHLGEIYYNQSEMVPGIFQFEKYLAKTNDITATALLADLYYDNGRETWPDAFDLYSQIIDRTDGVEKKIALANTGNIFFQYTNYRASLETYEKALKLAPDDPNLLFNMGMVLSRMKRYPEALQYFQKTLAIEPENDRPLMNIILVYQKMSRVEKAITLCEQHIAEKGGDLQFQILLASLYLRIKDYEKARMTLERMETDSPAYLVRKFLMLSYVLYNLGDNPAALAAVEKALTMDMSDHEALLNSGIILYAMGRFDEAISRFNKVVSVTEDNSLLGQAYLNLGNAYYRRGELALALDFYDKAMSLLPNSNAVHLNYAIVKKLLQTGG